MLRIKSYTGSSIILQSLIDAADEHEIDKSKSVGNNTNLLNPSVSKKSTKAGYLTFKGAKKGGGNPKKGVKAVTDSNYPTPSTKKAFNFLQYVFTPAPIFQHFDPKWHIRIETNALGYAIGRVLSQLTLNNLG